MVKKFCILNCEPVETLKILSICRDFSEFEFIGESCNYDESLNMVLKTEPELIIINIDHHYTNSSNSPLTLAYELFWILDYTPAFAAVSSTTNMAYETLRLGFFDYLLKPLSLLELRKGLCRFKKYFKENSQKLCIQYISDHRSVDLNNTLLLSGINTDFYLRDESGDYLVIRSR